MGHSNLFRFSSRNHRTLPFTILYITLSIWCSPSLLLGDELPYLIKLQPRPVHESWIKINELIKENASLEKPLPDPYLARAELWSLVGNHEEAIEDYLQEYEGQYDPLFQQKQPSASDNSKVSLQKKRTLDQEGSIIRKTVEKVKDKTESVIEDFTSKQTLSFAKTPGKRLTISHMVTF